MKEIMTEGQKERYLKRREEIAVMAHSQDKRRKDNIMTEEQREQYLKRREEIAVMAYSIAEQVVNVPGMSFHEALETLEMAKAKIDAALCVVSDYLADIGRMAERPKEGKARRAERRDRMEKKGTVGEIEKAVTDRLGAGYEVQAMEVEKNNGTVFQAITAWRIGEKACPVIYIDGIIKEIENGGRDIQDAAGEIARAAVNCQGRDTMAGECMDIADGLCRDKILEKVVFRMVNTEHNKNRLKSLPHRELLDLSAIYSMAEYRGGNAYSITISHELCSTYGISTEELDRAAWRNTKKGGFCVRTAEEIMGEITGVPVRETSGIFPRMYVLTNRERNNGASIILYKEFLGRIARELQSDLYIMPSSIHEIIAVADCGAESGRLREMVGEINNKEVAREEILGWNVYKYSLAHGELGIV